MRTRGHAATHLRTVAPTTSDRLTIDEVGRELRCSRSTVFRLLRERAFPSVKIGRQRLIERADVDAYVERIKNGTTAAQ
jgi:excisionase family DNA binding protein